MLRWQCSSFVVLTLTAARLPEVRQVGAKGKTEWIARAPDASLYITGNEVVFALPPRDVPKEAPAKPLYTHNMHMRLVGVSADVRGDGDQQLMRRQPIGAVTSRALLRFRPR